MSANGVPTSLAGLTRLETQAWRRFKRARIERLQAEINKIEKPSDHHARELASAKSEEQRLHRAYTAVAKHRKAVEDGRAAA